MNCPFLKFTFEVKRQDFLLVLQVSDGWFCLCSALSMTLTAKRGAAAF